MALKSWFFCAGLGLSLLLTACGQESTTPSATPTLEVRYSLVQGISGRVVTKLEIWTDGSLVRGGQGVPDQPMGKAPAEDLDALREIIHARAFQGLARCYGCGVCCDHSCITIAVQRGAVLQSVSWYPTAVASRPPAALFEAVRILNQLVSLP